MNEPEQSAVEVELEASRWIRPGEDDEWAALLTGFGRCAYRLEAQQAYSSDVEDAATARFLAGEPHEVDLSWMTSKLEVHRAAGRTLTWVRVTVEPPNAYTAMELTVYPDLTAVGQDTRIIAVADGDWPEAVPRHDYWLFDDRDVWRMHYDADDRWAGAELLGDSAALTDHLRWRDNALSQAMSLDTYLSRQLGEPCLPQPPHPPGQEHL